MKIIATTTQSVDEIDNNLASFLDESGINFVPRCRTSLKALASEHQAGGIIVWETTGPVLYMGEQKFFFHPSMSKNRLACYRKNIAPDLMARACQIKPGDDFLDCTLGLGADAIVASYFSGTGRIVGLEKSRPIFYVVKWGMRLYHSQMAWLDQAIKRINLLNIDHYTYLKEQPDKSFDIVYFDPMFRHPVLSSKPIEPLRQLADHEPLSSTVIQEACRVARKSVVMKELVVSGEIERLGFKKMVGSRYNKLVYGVIKL